MWNATLIFSNKNHDLQIKKAPEEKQFFTVDYKIIELHILHTWRHMQFE